MTKICTNCKQELDISNFPKKAGRPGCNPSYRSRCKSCIRILAQIAYHKPKVVNIKESIPEGHKKCKLCSAILPFEAFFKCCKNPIVAWHYDSICKKCKSSPQYQGYKQHSKKLYKRPSESLIEWQILNSKQKGVKNGLFKHGLKLLPFTINIESIRKLITDQTTDLLRCAVTNIPLRDGLLAPSIDRIDNSKGYVENNIRLVSRFYNLMRNAWSDVQIMKALSGLYQCGHQDWNNFAKTWANNKQKRSVEAIGYDEIMSLIDKHCKDGILRCASTGIKLTSEKDSPVCASMDRIDPKVGYKLNNIRIVARCVNLGRNAATMEECDIAVNNIIDSCHHERMVTFCGVGFFEDELIYKEHICEDIIRQKLGIKQSKIFLRPQKCLFKQVDNKEASLFQDKFHYMGGVASSFNFGMYHNNNLVACLSIRKPSGVNSQDDWEISRMVSDPTIHIHGVWSYLFSKVKSDGRIKGSIVTFSDNRLFDGEVCKIMGMTLTKEIPPSYSWLRSGVRYHRRQDRTDKQLLQDGFEKVWDLGKKKWRAVI